MRCPKKFRCIPSKLCLTRSPPRIFKSSVSSCNFFAVGKPILQCDTTVPSLISISRRPSYGTTRYSAQSWQTLSRSFESPFAITQPRNRQPRERWGGIICRASVQLRQRDKQIGWRRDDGSMKARTFGRRARCLGSDKPAGRAGRKPATRPLPHSPLSRSVHWCNRGWSG